jgi:citronellyl-CoA dehydrogenase
MATGQFEMIRESAKKFVETEINPYCDEWEKEGMYPAHDVFKKLGDHDFLGIHKPEAFGGLGAEFALHTAFLEALGYCNCGGVPMSIKVQTDMSTPALAKYGSDKLRAQFLAPSISGEFVSCIGVSETGAGSDVASIRTRAVKDGDDYIINGGKMWITNGTQGDWICLLCITEETSSVHMNKSLICVPLKENGKRAKGVTIERKLDKLGMRCSDTAEILFQDVRVPQWYRIGEPGFGFMYQMEQFQEERLASIVDLPIAMRRTIQDTIDYTRQRIAFGRPLLDNQVIHFKMAELSTEVEALDAMIERAVKLMSAGQDVTTLASMAKLKAGRLLRQLNDECLQYWGGMGYMEEAAMPRRLRDGRLLSIGGGADEIMLGIICKKMGILPGRKSSAT